MKLTQLFESQFPTSREEVEATCKKYEISNYAINDDLSIDVNGDVNLRGQYLVAIPIRFNYVSGDFWCNRNKLTSLKGAPKLVGGDFWCSWNKLESLEGAPREVGGSMWCSDLGLTSLKGAPREVGGTFQCAQNKLTNLIGAPRHVGGHFNCGWNELTTLEGAPKTVGQHFYCEHNPDLKSLDGIGNVNGRIFSDLE